MRLGQRFESARRLFIFIAICRKYTSGRRGLDTKAGAILLQPAKEKHSWLNGGVMAQRASLLSYALCTSMCPHDGQLRGNLRGLLDVSGVIPFSSTPGGVIAFSYPWLSVYLLCQSAWGFVLPADSGVSLPLSAGT